MGKRYRTYQEAARAVVAEAAAVDAAEDAIYGDARGDELPEELRTVEARRAWLRAARRELEEQRVSASRPIVHPTPAPRKEAEPRLQKRLWDEDRQV